MDGLKYTIPFADKTPQSLFDNSPKNSQEIFCKIKDWQTGEVEEYKKLFSR